MKKYSIILLIGFSVGLFAEPRSPHGRQSKQPTRRERNMQRIKNPSGLEYEILKEGNGVEAQAGKNVTVHYTGWLEKNGAPDKQFDSSVDRKQPFSFRLGAGRVIKGWEEGVQGMKVGEKRRLYIPGHLGYGQQGYPGIIPSNATLIFDVELLSVS